MGIEFLVTVEILFCQVQIGLGRIEASRSRIDLGLGRTVLEVRDDAGLAHLGLEGLDIGFGLGLLGQEVALVDVGDDVALLDRIPFLDAELDDTAGDFGVDVDFLGIGPAPQFI